MAANKRKILEAARKLLQKGAHEKALKEYHKLLKLDPRDAKLRLEIGDAYRRWGQVDEAVDTYTKVAEQYMSEGFDARAVAVFKQIQNLDPDRYASYAPLAELYQRMGLTSEAIAALQTAADGYHREGNKQEALRLLRRMAGLDPSNTTSRIKIADLLRQEGMNDEALEEYRAAASELERQGDLDAAAASLERVLELDPNDVPTLSRLARSRLARGDGRRAEPLARRALERELSPEGFELLADVYRALSRDEDVAQTYRGLADFYMERGEEDRARDIRQRFVPAKEFAGDVSAPDLAPRKPFQAELLDDAVLGDDDAGFLDDANVLGDRENSQSDLGAGFGDAAGDVLFGEDTLVGISRNAPGIPDEFLDDEPLLEAEGDGLGGGFGEIELDELDVGGVSEELDEVDPNAHTTLTPPPPQADLDQLLAEASVYLRYGKRHQAIENLQSILTREPRHRAALEKLGEAHVAGSEPGRALDAWMSAAGLAREAGDDLAFGLLRDRIAGLDASAAARLDAAAGPAEVDDDEVLDVSLPNLSAPVPADSGGGPGDPLDLGADLEFDLDEVEVDVEGLDDPDELAEEFEVEASPGPESREPAVDAPERLPALDQSTSFSMSQQILEDLEEADFYMQQGLLDEAEGIYRRLLEHAPNHPRVLVRLGEIAAERGDDPGASGSSGADAAPEPDEADRLGLVDRETGEFEVELPPCDLDEEEIGADLDLPALLEPLRTRSGRAPQGDPVLGGSEPAEEFDLAAELSEAFGDEAEGSSSGSQGSADDAFSSVFREFKRGVSQSLSEGDHEAHYDLGIAYREMGLLDDAMAEFRVAMESRERRVDGLHMLGLCALELGRADEAVKHLGQALGAPGIGRQQELAMRFELGRAFEAVGDLQRAREAYEAVAAIDPLFCEVEQRLVRLERLAKPDAGPEADPEAGGWESFEDVIAEANRGEPGPLGSAKAGPAGRPRRRRNFFS